MSTEDGEASGAEALADDVDHHAAAVINLALITAALFVVAAIYVTCWVMNCTKTRQYPTSKMRLRYRFCEILHDRVHHDHWMNHCLQLTLGVLAYACWALYVWQPQNDYAIESVGPLAWAVLFTCLFVMLSASHCVFKYRLLVEDEAYHLQMKNEQQRGNLRAGAGGAEPRSKSRTAVSISQFPESRGERGQMVACRQAAAAHGGYVARSGSLGGASAASFGLMAKHDPFDSPAGSGVPVPSTPASPSHASSVAPREPSHGSAADRDQFALSRNRNNADPFYDPPLQKNKYGNLINLPFPVSENDPFETITPANGQLRIQPNLILEQQVQAAPVLRAPQLIPTSVSPHSSANSSHHPSPTPTPRNAPVSASYLQPQQRGPVSMSRGNGPMHNGIGPVTPVMMPPTEVMPVQPQQAPTPGPIPIEPHMQPVTVVVGGEEDPDGQLFFKKVRKQSYAG